MFHSPLYTDTNGARPDLASSFDVQNAFQTYDAWVSQKLVPANRNVVDEGTDPGECIE
jgi:hypothetical protein